jgi:hypothetical protein
LRRLKEKLETATEIVKAINAREKLKIYGIAAKAHKFKAAVTNSDAEIELKPADLIRSSKRLRQHQ